MIAYIVLLVYLAIAVGLCVVVVRWLGADDIDYPWADE